VKPGAKRPCHVCAKAVAHYELAGEVRSNRGSMPHKCPHGQQCLGGDKLHRWGHMGSTPNCRSCSVKLQSTKQAK
jgi:hypothetical protein